MSYPKIRLNFETVVLQDADYRQNNITDININLGTMRLSRKPPTQSL